MIFGGNKISLKITLDRIWYCDILKEKGKKKGGLFSIVEQLLSTSPEIHTLLGGNYNMSPWYLS